MRRLEQSTQSNTPQNLNIQSQTQTIGSILPGIGNNEPDLLLKILRKWGPMNDDIQKRILLVQGSADPEMLGVLSDTGYVVESVSTLSESRTKLQAEAFSRVIVDSTMYSVLSEREEMYRNLVERSNDGVVVIQDSLVRFANPRFEQMSGYSIETLLNTPFTDYLTPEEIAVLLERYERRMAGEYVPSIYETTMTRRGGRKIPLEISAAIISFHGRPADLVVVRDITERKQAEEYLQRYRLLSESAHHDMFLFIGLDGRIIEANRAAAVQHGYSRKELLKMNIRDLRAADEPQAIRDQLERARQGSILFSTEHKRCDGSIFPVEVSVTGTLIQDEPVLLNTIRDISERMQAEAELKQIVEELRISRHEMERALDREKEFSMLLQRALLPIEPSLGDQYEVAVRYVAAYAGREIGGDFYDVFRSNDGWAGLLIGDVSGKGLEAASMAATTRSTIHAFVHEIRSASEVLDMTNSVVYPQQPSPESFVTVALITLDLNTGEMHYSNAGHSPVVILRNDGSVDFMVQANFPLGVSAATNYYEYADHMQVGEKMLLYTDGISEAHVSRGLFGEEGIKRTLAEHQEWSANEIADRLIAAATEWSEGRLRDDAALVVIHRLK